MTKLKGADLDRAVAHAMGLVSVRNCEQWKTEMKREDIIKLAREAGLDPDLWNYTDAFERFAALVAAAEREACAKLCEAIQYKGYVPPEDGAAADYYNAASEECADAIRARGQA